MCACFVCVSLYVLHLNEFLALEWWGDVKWKEPWVTLYGFYLICAHSVRRDYAFIQLEERSEDNPTSQTPRQLQAVKRPREIIHPPSHLQTDTATGQGDCLGSDLISQEPRQKGRRTACASVTSEARNGTVLWVWTDVAPLRWIHKFSLNFPPSLGIV